jgi:hypothetical protein
MPQTGNLRKIKLIMVRDALPCNSPPSLLIAFIPQVLGTWAGLCKIGCEGTPRKVVGCSCVVVKEYGVESEGLHVQLDYFKNR